jgi:hypothetical protein
VFLKVIQVWIIVSLLKLMLTTPLPPKDDSWEIVAYAKPRAYWVDLGLVGGWKVCPLYDLVKCRPVI